MSHKYAKTYDKYIKDYDENWESLYLKYYNVSMDGQCLRKYI